jgi:uncharacterized protein (TIGR02118 family)
MIKVSVFYPNEDGKKFDMDYYCNKHFALIKEKLGDALKATEVEEGLGGGNPGSRPMYIATGHLYFDSVESFQTAFGPHAGTFMSDIPNYTDIQPTIQISEVKLR